MAIELRVLGCFGLRIDGRRVEISQVPARILAYLAVQPGEVRRSTLAGVLWPEVPHDRALGNLRSALWRLPAGSRDAVAESGASLNLADQVLSDFIAVRHAVTATSADVPDVPDVLAWAWGEELLAGWYDDWVLDAREALQTQRALILEGLAATSGAAGRGGEALLFATLAVGAQPLRESAHRALLRAHLDLGHYQEAHDLYREFTRMREGFGVGRSVETSALGAAGQSRVRNEVA